MNNRKPPYHYYFAAIFAASLIAVITWRGDAAEAVVAGAFALIATALAALSGQPGGF